MKNVNRPQNTSRFHNVSDNFAHSAKDFPLVVNWHITETCNYRCQGCYSAWGHLNETWNSPENVRKVIENIARFHAERFSNGAKPWRLSVVGGEPILFKDKTQFVIETAVACGAEVSAITNGSHLENVFPFARLLSQVGVSLDSFTHETNLKIGRQCNGRTLSFDDIAAKLKSLSAINPNVRIKVNTVVNQNNFAETLVHKIAALGVSKYKILRQMPFGDCKGVTDEQFYTFLRNNYREDLFDNEGYTRHIYVEDNSVMTQSYNMVSPAGTLFQNGGAEYRYSRPLMDIPFETAMEEVGFAEEKFFDRYATTATDTIIARMHVAA